MHKVAAVEMLLRAKDVGSSAEDHSVAAGSGAVSFFAFLAHSQGFDLESDELAQHDCSGELLVLLDQFVLYGEQQVAGDSAIVWCTL